MSYRKAATVLILTGRNAHHTGRVVRVEPGPAVIVRLFCTGEEIAVHHPKEIRKLEQWEIADAVP